MLIKWYKNGTRIERVTIKNILNTHRVMNVVKTCNLYNQLVYNQKFSLAIIHVIIEMKTELKQYDHIIDKYNYVGITDTSYMD